MNRQEKAAEIAQSFQDKLSYWLDRWELQELRNRNAKEPNPYVCHSHDYLDANDTMAEAFDDCGADYGDEELWDMAWGLSAKFLGHE